MSEFMKHLRRELQLSGVAGTTILNIEHSLMAWGGGQAHYLPKRSEQTREEVRTLVRSGIHYRTAYRKINGR